MRILLILTATALVVFAVGCGDATKPAETNSAKTDNTEAANQKEDGAKTDANNGDAAKTADKNIVETASGSKDHTTLVTAVKAADLVETLSGKGPFTVFAPVNAAFEKLPKGTVDTLLKPENKDKLKGILTYHVVAGKLDAAAVAKAIKDNDGKAVLKTVQGEEITASLDGDKVVITDAKGGKSTITTADLMGSNGVIHVIDTVLMPSK